MKERNQRRIDKGREWRINDNNKDRNTNRYEDDMNERKKKERDV